MQAHPRAFAMIQCLLQLLLYSPVFPQIANRQQLRFDRISDKQGLPQVTVQSIVRDQRGFMWFATLDGLGRFDGYSVKSYRPIPGDSSSLPRADVIAMCVAHDGTLWIGTNGGGLSRYQPETESFVTFRHDSSDSRSIAENSVRTIVETRDGSLWIGTFHEGLDRLDLTAGVFHHYRYSPADSTSLSNNGVWSVYEDNDGTLWVGTMNGLNRLEPGGKLFQRIFARPEDTSSLTNNYIRAIIGDDGRQLWIGTLNGLNHFDKQSARSHRYYYHSEVSKNDVSSSINALSVDGEGKVWFGTSGKGLGHLNPRNGSITFYTHNAINASSMSDDFIWSLFRDPENRLWIGTYLGGVSKLDMRKQRIVWYRQEPDNLNSLSSNGVSAVAVSEVAMPGRLLVGTMTNGLNIIDRRLGTVSHFIPDRTKPFSLASPFILSIAETRDGRIYVGTSGGVDRFEPGTDRFVHVITGGSEEHNVYALRELQEGILWVGTAWQGVTALNTRTGATVQYSHNESNPRSLSNNRVLCFTRDRQGIVWVGTDRGLNRFNPATNDFDVYLHEPGDTNSLSNSTIISMHEDKTGNLWLATYGGGLNMLGPERKAFLHFRENDGLASDATLDVLEDNNGVLWISTTRGLSRFDPRTRRFKTYEKTDGLQANEFNMHASFKAKNGELFFGGINGLDSFFPDSLKDNPTPPPIAITGFEVFNKRTPLLGSVVVLPHDDNFFAFEFAGLEYTAPEKCQYAYMLEGIDNEWIYSGTRRYAGFTHIPPGHYIFRAKCCNSDGVWNEAGIAVSMTITPPYWRTWWFRTLVACMIVGLAALAYNYRVSKLLEMERLRFRIASDLHDDIGSNLGSIALAADMVNEKLPPHAFESQQLSHVSRTAREMGDAIRDIVWFIRPENDNTEVFIAKMKEVAANLLGKIEYSFDVDLGDLDQRWNLEFRRNVFLIFKESLHNIVRHSGATRTDIDISVKDGILALTITDNGIGLDLDRVHPGNGLLNLKTRAKQLGGTLNIVSSLGAGAIVRLIVPVT